MADSAQVFGLRPFGVLKRDVKIGPAFDAVHVAAAEKLVQNI